MSSDPASTTTGGVALHLEKIMNRSFVAAVAMMPLIIAANANAAETLAARTSKPNFSVYIPGEVVPIQINVSGISPGQPDQTLQIRVVNEDNKPVTERTIAVPGTEASWTTTIIGPSARLGFYRVFAKLPNGITLPKMGSRQAGYLTYCVVPDPATRTAYPPSEARFGMQGGFNGSLNPAPYLGINWVNGPGRWSSNEPDHSGQFAEKRAVDKAVGNTGPSKTPGATRGYEWCYVERRGERVAWPIYPVFWLYDPPTWAFVEGKKVGSTAPLRSDQSAAWTSYAAAFAKSIVEDYPNLDTHFYQITWEPNWFNGGSQQFVDIYRLAYKAIHDVDPKAIVAGPTKSGVGDFNMGDEADYFKLGFGSCIDGYTIHPYIKMPSEQQGFVEKVTNLIAFPSRRSGRAMPVYSTEQGDATGEDPNNELNQARDLIRSNLITLGEGARFYFAFFLHDYKNEPGFGYFYNLRDDEKFGTEQLAPKPVVPAFAAETSLIDGHATVGPLDYLGDTALGYAFQRKDDVVLALWDYSGKPRAVTIPVGVKSVRIYDWMGNYKTVPAVNGSVGLTLTQEPVYLRGVSPAVWGAGAVRILDLASSTVTTMPGGQVVVSVNVRATDNPLRSTLTTTANQSLGTRKNAIDVALKPGETRTIPIKLTIPTTTPVGTYVVGLNFANAARRLRVDISPPVKIAAITPSSMTSERTSANVALQSVKVSLSSTQAQTVTGMLSFMIDGVAAASSKSPFTVEPDADPVIEIPCRGMIVQAGKTYTATLIGKTGKGFAFKQSLSLGLIGAFHLSPNQPIEEAPLSAHMAKSMFVPSATLRLAWSDAGLLLSATVPDSSSPISTRHSNLQVAVNLDTGKVERSTGDVYNDLLARRRFSVLTFDLDGDTPRATRTYSYNGDKLHYGKLYNWQLPLKIVDTGGNTTYTATIPWKEVGATTAPKPGEVIGFGLATNAGTEDAPKEPDFTLFGGLWPNRNSDNLGDMVLAE